MDSYLPTPTAYVLWLSIPQPYHREYVRACPALLAYLLRGEAAQRMATRHWLEAYALAVYEAWHRAMYEPHPLIVVPA